MNSKKRSTYANLTPDGTSSSGILTQKDFQLSIARLVDDSVTTIYIPTPKGWKCKRKGCKMVCKHTHGTYPSLSTGKKRDNTDAV